MLRLVLSFLMTVTLVTLILKYHGGFTQDTRAVFGGIGDFEQVILTGGNVNQGHH